MRLHSLTAFPLTSALIINVRNSGPACPTPPTLDITATDSFPVLTLSVPDFYAVANTRNLSSCGISLAIEDGDAGRSLVLESVEVWGRLGLDTGARGWLMTAAYWTEEADFMQISQQNTSTARPFSDYVFVASSFDLPSACTGRNGEVGILNVGFRVEAEEGEVTFGPHDADGTTAPVSEHLRLRWDEC